MKPWQNFLTFYAVAGVVFGLMVATMKKVEVNYGDKRLPYPRLLAFVGVGLFWWAFLLALVFEPLFRKSAPASAAVDEPATPEKPESDATAA